ncbi:Histidine-specific methyltransferase EgtD [compost metagenome]
MGFHGDPLSGRYSITDPAGVEIILGLRAPQKRISSKYFYDDKGTELFQKISQTPEYYLTLCEKEILKKYAVNILDYMDHDPFSIIELGAGDGSKAALLLTQALKNKNFQNYYAVDISAKALNELSDNLEEQFDNFVPHTLEADFFDGLAQIESQALERRIVLFLGSSLGNLLPQQAHEFLQSLAHNMREQDLLVLGLDLKKDERILSKAYNDKQGLTAEFNLNLLTRINREWGANFNLDNFEHMEVYNPGLGAMESYLMSKVEQTVFFEDFNTEIHFAEGELIHTEYSFKYNKADIMGLIQDTGLTVQDFLYDRRRYFTTVLLRGPSRH